MYIYIYNLYNIDVKRVFTYMLYIAVIFAVMFARGGGLPLSYTMKYKLTYTMKNIFNSAIVFAMATFYLILAQS